MKSCNFILSLTHMKLTFCVWWELKIIFFSSLDIQLSLTLYTAEATIFLLIYKVIFIIHQILISALVRFVLFNLVHQSVLSPVPPSNCFNGCNLLSDFRSSGARLSFLLGLPTPPPTATYFFLGYSWIFTFLMNLD